MSADSCMSCGDDREGALKDNAADGAEGDECWVGGVEDLRTCGGVIHQKLDVARREGARPYQVGILKGCRIQKRAVRNGTRMGVRVGGE